MTQAFETLCIHGGQSAGGGNELRSLSYPIYQTATFSHVKVGHNDSGFDYSRETNPTRHRVEATMAALEHAEAAFAFSSGMAAIATVLELFNPGDEILCSNDLYGGVFRLHRLVSEKNGLTVRYIDTADTDAVRAAITDRTRAVYLETPTNPMMHVSDIAACAQLAHDHDAILIVDNTFMTPCFQNPLDLGADIVIHSASKYLGGHNDVIGGFLCVNDEALAERLFLLTKTLGNALAPFDSWLILRGLKTLAIRMERQADNALRIARWLERQPIVASVRYPGLESFPAYDLLKRQCHGFSAMISFTLTDGAYAEAVLTHLNVITFAESLGGAETLITYPIIQTHADTPDELKAELGINDRLLRLSVGLEACDDLIADLAQAFDRVQDGNGLAASANQAPAPQASPFDFDRVIDRRGTYSLKFDGAKERGYADDVLPLWVADMDFPCAPAIRDALHTAVDFGIFGYSDVDKAYYDTVVAWFERRFQWRPDPEWIVKTPGVVFAIAQCIEAFTEPGDAVLIQPPVYYPFSSLVKENGRALVENELVYENGRYAIDFEDFERRIIASDVKLFILCSPHNPVGRVWTRQELRRLAAICALHGVRVIADEIHCDLVWPGHVHTMFAQAIDGIDVPWISCTAPSKSFNLAGLQISHLFVPDEHDRERLKDTMLHNGYSQLNLLGMIAARAAYEQGDVWLDACLTYLKGNLDYLRDYLRERLPALSLIEPEGTYFAWIDCSQLGLTDKELDRWVLADAKLWLDGGSIFGAHSGQFQRVVLACPRATLTEMLTRLEQAIATLPERRLVPDES